MRTIRNFLRVVYFCGWLMSTTNYNEGRVRFLQSAWRGEHDDPCGHHYYTRIPRPAKPEYSSDDPCGHHGAGTVIMGRGRSSCSA